MSVDSKIKMIIQRCVIDECMFGRWVNVDEVLETFNQ